MPSCSVTCNLKAALGAHESVTDSSRRGRRKRAANAKNEYYRDEESFLFALADALRTEYRAIIDAGLDRKSTTHFFRSPTRRWFPDDPCAVSLLGEAAHRGLEPRAGGPAARAHPISYLLG